MSIVATYNPASIRNLPAEQQERALEIQLDRARTALALALEASDIHMVAQIKGGTAVMEKLSKELRLSKECQLDAAEMVRRSEYALGKALRQGQENGTIRTQGQRESKLCTAQTLPPRASEFATHAELYGNGPVGAGIYALAAADETEFEDAISKVRDEGVMTRSSIIREVNASRALESRSDRAGKIEPLAREGLTSEQIAKRIGLHRESVKRIARDHGIEIQADRVTANRHKVKSAKVLESTAAALEGAVYSIRLVQPEDLSQEEAQEWVDSLTESIKALSKAVKTIKEYHS